MSTENSSEKKLHLRHSAASPVSGKLSNRELSSKSLRNLIPSLRVTQSLSPHKKASYRPSNVRVFEELATSKLIRTQIIHHPPRVVCIRPMQRRLENLNQHLVNTGLYVIDERKSELRETTYRSQRNPTLVDQFQEATHLEIIKESNFRDSKNIFHQARSNSQNQGLKFHSESFTSEARPASDSDNPWNVKLKKRDAYQALSQSPIPQESSNKEYQILADSRT